MDATLLWDDDGPLLRPARPQGGSRPPARRGGHAARIALVLAVVVTLQLTATGVASADTTDVSAYRTRLRDARALLLQARAASDAERPAIVERVRGALLQTTAVRTADGRTVRIDDSRVAARLDPPTTASIDNGVAELDQLIAMADRAASPPFDLAKADARLRDLAAAEERQAAGSGLFTLIALLLSRLFGSPNARLPEGTIETILSIIGGGLLVVVLAILVRGVRERIRRETVQPGAPAEAAASPFGLLSVAERALGAGDSLAALHAFYRYAILTLAERRLVRYEPSLTDRELLERATSLPQVDTLRELISLHDRAWFGLKGATAEDAQRARGLAERAVA